MSEKSTARIQSQQSDQDYRVPSRHTEVILDANENSIPSLDNLDPTFLICASASLTMPSVSPLSLHIIPLLVAVQLTSVSSTTIGPKTLIRRVNLRKAPKKNLALSWINGPRQRSRMRRWRPGKRARGGRRIRLCFWIMRGRGSRAVRGARGDKRGKA